MTYSNTYSSPSSPTNFNPFSGMGMRKGGRPSLFPGSGDGSTLSLDFTTGVLDPRLTFSRASTATFVNSSGYVQFANANCFTYSNPRSTGTAWSATGTVTWNGTGGIADPTGGTNAQSITYGTAASAIFNTAGTIVTSGITHTFSVWLRAASGTTNARIGSANTGAVSTVALTTTWQRFSCQYVTNGTNDGGAIYSQTVTATPEIYVWGAQVQPGSIVGDLIQTSGTQNYSTPRFDYSPTNIGEPRGLLIEGQTANVANNSNALASAGGLTRTYPTGITSPDGTENAQRFTKSDATTSRYIYPTTLFTVAASTAYTFSIWFKYDGFAFTTQLQSDSASDWNTGWGASFVIASSGVTTGSRFGGCSASTVTPYPNGWYRCTATITTGAAPTGANPRFLIDVVGTTGVSVLVYGLQLEAGSGASSYVPTGASGVTRNADSCTVSGTNFSSWFTQGEGTLYAYSDVVKSNSRNLVARIENAAASNYIEMGLNAVGYTTEAVAYAGGAFTSAFSAYTPVVNVPYKSAYTWSSGRLNLGANGTIATAASATLATDLIRIGIGGAFNVTDVWVRNGHIRELKYYPMVMTNAQLQALTAP